MTSRVYRFADYRLAPAARELWQGDALVALPPKSFDCLAYLIEHHERAVGRDELISAVWGRVDVSDDLLAQTLRRARLAVGDTGNAQRAIRTVPRFGYRWVWPIDAVEVLPAALDETPPTPTPTPQPPPATRRWRWRWLALAAMLLAVLGIALAALLWHRGESPAAAIASDAGVLVLPMRAEGGDADSTWLRLGAMDAIATRLRDRGRLKVLPSEQTLLVAPRDFDPADPGALHRIELATGTHTVIAPTATFDRDEWKVLLDVYDGASLRSFVAHAPNPLHATAIAADRYLASRGVETPAPGRLALADMQVERLSAALLAGDLDEAWRLIAAMPADLKSTPQIAMRIGQVAFRAGRLDEAEAAFAKLVDNGAAVPADVRVHALMGLGSVAVRRGDFDEADRRYSAAIAALEAASASPDPALLGIAYSGRAVAHSARRNVNQALADFGRARVELERAGDRTGAAMVDANLGVLDADRGHYADATRAFDRAVATFTRFDVHDDLAATLLGRCKAQLALLDQAAALDDCRRAQALVDALENPLLRQRVTAAHVAVLLAGGALSTAQDVLDRHAGDAARPRDFGILRAMLELERGDVAAAARTAQPALDGAVGDGDDDADGAIAVRFAVTATRRGAPAELLDKALHALPADTGGAAEGWHPLEFARLLGEAQHKALANDAAALGDFQAVLARADRNGAPEDVVTAGVAYAAYLLGHHLLEPAPALAGRLDAYASRDYRAARALAALYLALGNTELADTAQAQARRLAGERDPRLPL